MKDIKLTLLSRMRNEALLLPDFLKHIDPFIDEAFFFDDCSEDNTVEILRAYPKTKEVLRNYFHNPDQSFVQTAQRKMLLENYRNSKDSGGWFILIEPDERINFNFDMLEEYDRQNIDMVYFRLFDAYITPEDQKPYEGEKLWNFRKYFGPEYRNIGFLFRKNAAFYDVATTNCRQPYVNGKTTVDGLAQHYGKSLSIKQWEDNCDYYTRSVPALAEKWSARRGKAIHEVSDFNRPLYTWKQIISKKNFSKLVEI